MHEERSHAATRCSEAPRGIAIHAKTQFALGFRAIHGRVCGRVHDDVRPEQLESPIDRRGVAYVERVSCQWNDLAERLERARELETNLSRGTGHEDAPAHGFHGA
jgi:hypothetical protein